MIVGGPVLQSRAEYWSRSNASKRPLWPLQPQSTPHFASSHPSSLFQRQMTALQGLPRAPLVVSATSGAAAALTPVQQPGLQPKQLRVLYPTSTAHASGHLRVSDLHSIYYEVHGNPNGVPAVVVHGGPGAGCFSNHARFFDPHHFRIILLDQRGCGRSTPNGCLADNTTAALVGDLELLRQHLGVCQWVMLGGSWGVALSIAFAQAHPYAVLGLVLRGVCLMRPQEIQWMYGGGAAALKPLAWHSFVGRLPQQQQGNPLLAYYKRLLNPDPAVRNEAAKAWMGWEMAVGFSSQPELLVWNGQQWASSPHPQQQQQKLPPPPQPVGPAAASAAAPEAALRLHELHRGASILAEVLAGACSPGQQSEPSFAAAAAADSCHRRRRSLHKHSSSTSSESAAAADGQQQAWIWGLPAQGFNLEDPEVSQLVWQGLNDQGFSQQGFGAQALLEAHYSLHGAFLLEQPLLDHVSRIRHIPCIAVQGQADLVCPPVTAVDLSQAWPEMELRLVPGAGHSMYDPAITHELVNATDRMRGMGGVAAAAGCGPRTGVVGGAAAAAAAATKRLKGLSSSFTTAPPGQQPPTSSTQRLKRC